MKVNLNKILFLIFLIIAFTININATVIDCSNGKGIIINETSKASPSGMKAYMPICAKIEPVYEPPGSKNIKYNIITNKPGLRLNKQSASAVAEYRKTVVEVAAIGIDNKYNSSIDVQICNDDNALLKATMTCDKVIEKAQVTKECTEFKEGKEYNDCMKTCKKPVQEHLSSFIENPNVEQMRIENDCKICETKKECTKWKTVYSCNKGTYKFLKGKGTGKNKDLHACVEAKSYNTTKKVTETEIKSDNTITSEVKRALENNCKGGDIDAVCACYPETVEYNLQCPINTCVKGIREVNMCTPDFEESETGNTVYCVNPSQPFSSEYLKDESFNIKNCDSSFSTVDCGYANILIEGEYYKFEKKAIELALRLWGVFQGQSGFEKVGVSNRKNDDCSLQVIYMPDDDDNIVNPYKKTFEEFNKVLFSQVTGDYIDLSGDLSHFTLTCDKSKLGVACGESTTTMQAYALLANTMSGNDKMQDHLKELFGGGISEKVQSVNLLNGANKEQYIDVHLVELNKVFAENDVEINCRKLDQMVREGTITKKQKAQIEPYCKIELTVVDGRGNVLNGNINLNPDYCNKEYCRVKIKKFAVCDLDKEVTTPITVKVTYTRSNNTIGVNKYVSCSNPSENQIMMGFDDELVTNTESGKPNNENSTEKVTDEFVLSNFKCDGTCDNYEPKGEIRNKCSDDKKNYNKTFNSSIKDPSLKCILNMSSPTYKDMYDYSGYFGVNTNVCRIYCSDEVKYYIADKVKEKSGRVFYYDIEKSARSDKNINYLFSNIVKEKRTCVSEIYYNKEFNENLDWKNLYNLGFDYDRDGKPDDGITRADINGITNWSSLFGVLAKKAEYEGSGTSDLNDLIYDLYNCNLYSQSEIYANGITIPRSGYTGNIKENIASRFSRSNNYGIGQGSGCSITNTSNNCITMKDIKYNFGAKPNGNKAVMKSITTNKNTLDKLVYCSGNDCFAYSEDTKDNEYNYPTSTRSKTSYVNIRTYYGDRLYRTRIQIPTNDYVMFEATTEVSFYNSSKFEVKPSGEVILPGSNTTSEKYMQLKPFTYPINKDAYNLEACTSRKFLPDLKRCEITQQYNNFQTYYRKNKNDEFSSKVKLANKFSCFVDVAKPSTIDGSDARNSTIYRNVDPANLFPSSKDGYATDPKSNWSTKIGKKATDEIRSSANDLITTENYLDYRITLSPTQINNIKSYNDRNGSYIDEKVTNCQIVEDTYQKCSSPFIDELRSSSEYGTLG